MHGFNNQLLYLISSRFAGIGCAVKHCLYLANMANLKKLFCKGPQLHPTNASLMRLQLKHLVLPELNASFDAYEYASKVKLRFIDKPSYLD